MLIGGVPGGPVPMARPARRGRAGQGAEAASAFGAHLVETGEPEQASAAQPAAPPPGIGTVVVMSRPEQSDAARDRQAESHGQALLGALGDLQMSVLNDGGSEALEALSRLASVASDAADPGLGHVVRAIGQRVAVELAKAEARSP